MRIRITLTILLGLIFPSFAQMKPSSTFESALSKSGKEITIQELEDFVTKHISRKDSIAKFFYYWIALNIEYDNELALSKPEYINYYEFTNADTVFKNRKTVCSGYSNLYQTLLNDFDIECITINGYSKTYPNYITQEPLQVDHSWNAVRINKKWLLVDVTWANTTKINHKISDFYFGTPPEIFIFNHLPEDDEWQLLNKKFTLKEFEELPYISSKYFHLGFGSVAPELIKNGNVYRIKIGKSSKWYPSIKISEGKQFTGVSHETIKFKEYEELIFNISKGGRSLIKIDAYRVDEKEQIFYSEPSVVYFLVKDK